MSRDRDRILEQALKHELRASGTPPAGACLDAETLGAWTDDGLSPAALEAVEAHVSSCARCQLLVEAMARSIPVAQAQPEVRGFSVWKWWFAPMAAGVAAVALWMVVPEQQKLATAPPESQISAPARVPDAPGPLPPATPTRDAAVEQFDRVTPRETTVAETAREDRQQKKSSGERKEKTADLQERANRADMAAPPAAAAPPSPAPPALRAPAQLGALQEDARRIVAPPGIEVTHQSAPSDSVCWFVGRAGLVLLTTDAGATFTRVDLPEPLDIASVSATDARQAIVSTVDGRRFRTEDGGRLWRPF